MSANISVHIVHSKPSTKPVKLCLLCVKGHGQYMVKNSTRVIQETVGLDLSLLTNVPEADHLFCSDCKVKLEQVLAFRKQVQQMYSQMCAILHTKAKLQKVLCMAAPEAKLSFSVPSAVLTFSTNGKEANKDKSGHDKVSNQMSNFLVTLNVHLDEDSSNKSVVMDTINSHLDVDVPKTSSLDNLFDASPSGKDNNVDGLEIPQSTGKSATPAKKLESKKGDKKEAKPKDAVAKKAQHTTATPTRMRTRGIKLDFTSTFVKRRERKASTSVQEKTIPKNVKIPEHENATNRRFGRPPKKIYPVASEEEKCSAGIETKQNITADEKSQAKKRKLDDLDNDDANESDSGMDHAEENSFIGEGESGSDDDPKAETQIKIEKPKVPFKRPRGRPPQSNFESFIRELGWKNDVSDFEIIKKLTEQYGKNYHSLEEPFQCGYCGELFVEVQPLTEHVENKHKDKGEEKTGSTSNAEEPFKCSFCSMTFTSTENLKEHAETHNKKATATVNETIDPNEPSTCGICGRTVMNLKELAKHILNVHQDSGNFECDVCHKKFGCHWYLREHKIMHNKSYSYICEYCGWPYKRPYDYKMHLLTHTGKGFLCNVCGMECRTQYDLKLHKYNAHKTFKEFQCLFCYKTLKENKHILKHSCFQSRSKEVVVEKVDKSGRPFYVCKFCSETYNKKSHLAVHMLKEGHFPLKPGELAKKWRIASLAKGLENAYTCPNCQMSFSTAKETKSHIESEVCVNETRKVMEEELKKIVQDENVALLKETSLVRCKESVMDQSVFCKCPNCHCLIANLALYKAHISNCVTPGHSSQENVVENNPIPDMIIDSNITISGNQIPAYEPVLLGPRAEKFVKRLSKKAYPRRASYSNSKIYQQKEILVDCESEVEANVKEENKTAVPMTTYLCAVCNSMFMTLEEVHEHMRIVHEAEVESLANSEPQTLMATDTLVVEEINQNGDLTFNAADGVIYTTAISNEMFSQ